MVIIVYNSFDLKKILIMNCYGESVLDDTIFCGYPKCILLNMTINCNTKDHV